MASCSLATSAALSLSKTEEMEGVMREGVTGPSQQLRVMDVTEGKYSELAVDVYIKVVLSNRHIQLLRNMTDLDTNSREILHCGQLE